MAVPTTQLEVSYVGSGVGPYTIPFPFLATSHIRAAVSADGEEDAVLLSSSAYTVTRLPSGAGGTLTLDEAVADPEVLVIYREVPLTQPTVFPLAGPFPAKAVETAFDRLLMQHQQLDRRVSEITGEPGGTSDDPGTAFGRWNPSTSYAIGDVATGGDQNQYRAVLAHSGENPTGDTGTNWKLWRVNSSITLNVPARFATLAAAWDFAADAFIGSATVTIQLADGNHVVSRKLFNHPCGSRFRILGNVTTPTSCVLNASAVVYTSGQWATENDGLIAVSAGQTLGFIDGFRILGPGRDQTGMGALFAIDGAVIIAGEHMIIEDFYFPVASFNGGVVRAFGITVSGGGDGNFMSYNGSVISVPDCVSSGADGYFAKAGALAEHCSTVWAPNGTFSNNAGHQAACHFGSSLMLRAATISVTGGLVGLAGGIRMLDSDGCDLDSITYVGIERPQMRLKNVGIDGSSAQHFMSFGLDSPFSPAAKFNFVGLGNEVVASAVTQENIGTLWDGFKAGSTIRKSGTTGAQYDLIVGMDGDMNGTVGASIFTGGIVIKAPAAALADGTVANGAVHFYLDEATHKLKFKVKYAAGTVKSGEVALT